ncbi:MAG: hypothetical protein MUC38_02725 [Cyclobacteriaceae bacterium]|jgi:hypothetical protein|nr:hypothetical protein [Cyclobacteriaceae bacterium]
MDLQQAWNKLRDERLSKPTSEALNIGTKSKHPIQKLKSAYLTTTLFAVVFLFVFVALLFVFREGLIQAFLWLMIASYTAAVMVNYRMYQRLEPVIPPDQDLKSVLVNTHVLITKNIRMQEYVALFIYPFAGATGFFMGGATASGDIMGMLAKQQVIIALIIMVIVLTPACFYLSRWLYRVSYGKCLNELQERINALDDPA